MKKQKSGDYLQLIGEIRELLRVPLSTDDLFELVEENNRLNRAVDDAFLKLQQAKESEGKYKTAWEWTVRELDSLRAKVKQLEATQ